MSKSRKTRLMSRREKLMHLQEVHNLSNTEVGEMLDRTEKTVRIWRCVGGADIPTHMLELLEVRIAKRAEKLAANRSK
ncbi:hypothetical protein [Bacteriophage Phobos]|uniref:Uncharacterized protein n=1 Tax=Bacteriophage Phobos TaxID=2662138 RepID=A0A5Q2U9D1_9CAUD|nr:transcriptional repressor [Bacteriophage Phobos]QGH44977.1 hypothetical protein [Bacteriophage Phobos]WPK42373.1 hypothetical protein [Pseudomonas phage Ppu-503]